MTLKRSSQLISRRKFLNTTGALGLLALTKSNAWAAAPVLSGFLSPFFAFDREIQKFMQVRNIPGGALAVLKDGRLVYTRGYGWADRENKVPVKPTSLFRIASISKPFTAVAVLKLVETAKLDLKACLFELLDLGAEVLPAPGGKLDERWKQITVRHLLNHTGGWDRDKSFDPMFRPREIATAFGLPSPPAPRVIIRYMLGKPLDFDPPTHYAYSNFGYCVLGRVIEKIAGTSYEKFVQEKVLAPIGIRQMRIGASLADKRAEGEVRYYTPRDETAESVQRLLLRLRLAGAAGGKGRQSQLLAHGKSAGNFHIARAAPRRRQLGDPVQSAFRRQKTAGQRNRPGAASRGERGDRLAETRFVPTIQMNLFATSFQTMAKTRAGPVSVISSPAGRKKKAQRFNAGNKRPRRRVLSGTVSPTARISR